jgi:hypothetical protein
MEAVPVAGGTEHGTSEAAGTPTAASDGDLLPLLFALMMLHRNL